MRYVTGRTHHCIPTAVLSLPPLHFPHAVLYRALCTVSTSPPAVLSRPPRLPYSFLSTRGHVWTDVDASRTGGLPFVFSDDMSFEA